MNRPARRRLGIRVRNRVLTVITAPMWLPLALGMAVIGAIIKHHDRRK